jgi:amidase
MTFLGTKYTEAGLLSFAYAYEQASRMWRPPTAVNPSLFRCTEVSDLATSCAP